MNRLLTSMALAAFVPSILCDTSGFRQKAGLERRIDRFCSRVPSTTPLEELCEKSCGTGYTQCTNYYTCFNPDLGQVCCPDGHYCDAGEYCAQDSSGSQICCKHGEPCNDIATLQRHCDLAFDRARWLPYRVANLELCGVRTIFTIIRVFLGRDYNVFVISRIFRGHGYSISIDF